MQSIDIEYYSRFVEAYILDRTGKKVRIVLNEPMRINRDVMLLCQAYDIAEAYYKNRK